jgi:hypothetical protein
VSTCNVHARLFAEIWKTEPKIGQRNMTPMAQQYKQQATDTFADTT